MGVAVLGASFIPLVIESAAGSSSPFLLNAAWRLGVGLGCLAIAWIFFGRLLLRDGTVLWQHRGRLMDWALFGTVVGSFDYAFFALSLRFIDIAVATILIETYPLLVILLSSWLYRRERRYRRNLLSLVVLLAVCFVGFVLLVSSQSESVAGLAAEGFISGGVIWGVGLAFGGALAVACAAFTFRWCDSMSREVGGTLTTPVDARRLSLFFMVVALAVCNLVSAPVNAAIGAVSGESISVGALLVGVFVGGILVQTLPSVAWRSANLVSNDLGVNALLYGVPVLSVVWLWLLSDVDVARADYFVIGVVGVVCGNLLINFEAEVRWGFKALVLGLAGCGAVVVLRDEVFRRLDVSGFDWYESGYFEALALSATVFTLILSFRVARFVSRARDEDNQVFSLFRALESLARRGVVSREACEAVLEIASANGRGLEESYSKCRRCLEEAMVRAGRSERDRLVEAEVGLDSLAHSRRQGINFGEFCALMISGVMTVWLALFSKPGVSGVLGFMSDIFTMLFSAVVIFLMVNVLDLQHERGQRLLTRSGSRFYRGFGLSFGDSVGRTFEQWLSVGASLSVTTAYGWLLWLRWVG